MKHKPALGNPGKPYKSKSYSIFAHRPLSIDPRYNFGVFILLTKYMEQRSVSRSQVNRFARKKWIAVTRNRNRIYVSEVCTDAINEDLGV
ncbi:hypothetical protein C7H19_23670 [Aphanothece hegewaldii CCALA 016]|uniref:Uncharacterized protein n=1 Tax=Aphanothece hegewaldii CCALA 016 TaxID=2107694 RepID=A0A2T1LR41_9CHRO|nr:hypothetical protein [Aphanothece hegewaldii]PSF30583.1 hypothetical protein C7H19_23670 [Aphanothece hegewaldii CCALA 016]